MLAGFARMCFIDELGTTRPNSWFGELSKFPGGDFGLSKLKEIPCLLVVCKGLPWMAPELLNGSSNKILEKLFNAGFEIFQCISGMYTLNGLISIPEYLQVLSAMNYFGMTVEKNSPSH